MVQTFHLYILVSPRTMSQAITPFIPSNYAAVQGAAQVYQLLRRVFGQNGNRLQQLMMN
jgi:hypothetical protein